MFMRCTTLLYFIGGSNLQPKENFPYIEILNLLETSIGNETTFITKIKQTLKRYVSDHLEHFNRREWLIEILPALRTAIENISQLLNKTKGHMKELSSILKDFLKIIISDLNQDDFINTSIMSFIEELSLASNDPSKILPYFNFKFLNNLISMITNPKDLCHELLKSSEAEMIGLWKYCDQQKLITILEGVAKELKALTVCPKDNNFLALFKVYTGVMIFKFGENLNEFKWMTDLTEIVRKTISNLSNIESDEIPKEYFFSFIEDFLMFIVTYGTKTNHYVTGRGGGREIDLRQFATQGMQLYGRLESVQGTQLTFRDDLQHNLDQADGVAESIKRTIDAYIEKNEIDAPLDAPYEPAWEPTEPTLAIDLASTNISTVIWATGYHMTFEWIDVPVFNGNGYPTHERGVTTAEGLYFLGLPWLYTWGSGRFSGVARDATYLADYIAIKHQSPTSTPTFNQVAVGS